ELRKQLAVPGPTSSLELGIAFSRETMTTTQRDALLEMARSVENAAKGRIQRVIEEIHAYSQLRKSLSLCSQRFTQEWSSLLEISQELEHVPPDRSISIPQNAVDLGQFITKIENNLKIISEWHTKPGTTLIRFRKEAEKQELQNLLLRTRDLLLVAGQVSNYTLLIPKANEKFTSTIATGFAADLRQQFKKQQQEAAAAYDATFEHIGQQKTEFHYIEQKLSEDEKQV